MERPASHETRETLTLLDWACLQHPDTARKRLKAWIAEGRFRLDEAVVTQAGLRMPDPGERLRLGDANPATAAWAHRKRIHPKLTVVYLDAALAVVEKQAGLLSVPLEGSVQPSALGLLAAHLADPKAAGLRKRLFGRSPPRPPLAVHRLDQYTSGLLCFAMNPEARSGLIEQVRSRALHREYVAFADGVVSGRNGVWKHPLALDAEGMRQRLTLPEDRHATLAISRFEVMETFSRYNVTKLRLRLDTGLKHQLRIQAAAEGVPLLGDRLYHEVTRRLLKKGGKAPFGLARQALHAAVLGLTHPSDNRPLRFESRLPADLQRLEARLRSE